MYDTMTAREFLTYFANLRKVDTKREMVSLAERFELDLDRKIKDFSTGNRQKVGVVNAFMHEPELLILDEPTAGLDPLMQQEFQGLINEVRAEGRTVFLSSHILPEVDRIARTYFRYLNDTEAQVDVILGDARLSLERESSQAFDILVLDAFNSDAIPAHLLTKEAFEIYARHLKPDGVIAVHISNRHFNLQPLLRQLAQHLELESLYVENGDAPGEIWRAKFCDRK